MNVSLTVKKEHCIIDKFSFTLCAYYMYVQIKVISTTCLFSLHGRYDKDNYVYTGCKSHSVSFVIVTYRNSCII